MLTEKQKLALEDIDLIERLDKDEKAVLFAHIKENKKDFTELISQIEELKLDLENSINDIELLDGKQGEKGDKGDKGDTGEQGPQGATGASGRDGKDGVDGLDGQDGLDGLDGIDGRNGKDGSPDTGEQIVTKINDQKTQIDASKIKNLPQPVINNIVRGSGVVGLETIKQDGITKSQSTKSLNFTGSVVTKDSDNVTVSTTASSVPNTPAGGISSTNVQSAINELDTEKTPMAIHTDSKEPTGFVNRTDSSWTFVDGTRKLTVTTASSYDIYFAGVKHTITTSKEKEISNVDGTHYVYFDTDDTLKEYVNPTEGELLTLITQKCLVGIVYWDATNNVGVYVGEERHGIEMDGITHYYLHNTRGLQYVSGLGLGDFVIGNGSLDTHAQFSVATGTIADEDIGLTVADIASTTGLPILYREGANGYWRTVTQAGFSCYQNPAGTTNRLMYNQLTGGSWTTTEIGEGDCVLYHIFATTGKVKQMYSIMGQNDYTTLRLARLGAQTEISALILGDLPGPEIRPIATVIFQTDKDYGNTINARVIEVDGSGTDDYVDWRTSELPRGVTASDHGSLTGLLDDDHTQYLRTDGTRNVTGDLRGTEFIGTRSATLTHNGSGFVTQKAMTGGLTWVYTRDANNFITSKTDGTNTWTYTRDANNLVTAVTVT